MENLKILQINTNDIQGGAAKVSYDLHKSFIAKGYYSYLVVKNKQSNDNMIIRIPTKRDLLNQQRYYQYLKLFLSSIKNKFDSIYGIENFHYPYSCGIYKLIPETPDLIHAHNLHGNYFDLRTIPKLSKSFPFIITLHDSWLFSGHCAHSFSCQRWKNGCGSCPDLSINPPIKKDATAYNWNRKKKIFSKSNLFLVSPSYWLKTKIDHSFLNNKNNVIKVIHNGVDFSIFNKENRLVAKEILGFNPNIKICLFVANGIKNNMFKDFQMLEKVLNIVSENYNKEVLFLALGEDEHDQNDGKVRIKYINFTHDPKKVALYYQAADIYLHPSKVDTFPNSILEAMACGTPVIASNVGGISEQIQDGVTGFLVSPGDYQGMTEKLLFLLDNTNIGESFAKKASMNSEKKFNLEFQSEKYLEFYREAVEFHKGKIKWEKK